MDKMKESKNFFIGEVESYESKYASARMLNMKLKKRLNDIEAKLLAKYQHKNPDIFPDEISGVSIEELIDLL